MVFTTLALLQLGHAPAVPSGRESFSLGARSNPFLLVAVLGAVAVQLAILYLVAWTAAFVAVELEKWILRRQSRKSRRIPA